MSTSENQHPVRGLRVGYIVKRYPRFSETFIVNEILAHEAAGQEIEVFAIRPCNDTHFQERIAKVSAPVTHLEAARPKAPMFLDRLRNAARSFPGLWNLVAQSEDADPLTLSQAIALAEIVQERRIGHLHAHFATLPASVASIAAQLAGISFTFTAHAKDIFHESVVPAQLKRKLLSASRVITVSEFNLEFLQAEYGLSQGHTRRVYNGLDLDNLPFSSPTERRPLILGVGRLVEKKGFDDLVRACALLKQQGIDFECQIAGGGEREDQLRALIRELDVEQHVSLLGPIPQARLISMVHTAAVVAAPCVVSADGDRDGLPTIILEAMALGTPCVATPVTGIPEVVSHEETGLIVPQRAPAALAVAMQRLMGDGDLRKMLAANSRNLIESQFDSRKTAFQLREVFNECASLASAELICEGQPS